MAPPPLHSTGSPNSGVSDEHLLSLHRYFMTADALRKAFERHVTEHPNAGNPDDPHWPHNFGLMTAWYGALNVVLEGWQSLGLTSPDVDELLASPRRRLLNDLRNASFHYQREYLPPRVYAFIGAKDSAAWVVQLNLIIGLRIVNEMQLRRGRPLSPVPTVTELNAQFGIGDSQQ